MSDDSASDQKKYPATDTRVLDDEVRHLRRLNSRRALLAICSLALTLVTFAEFVLAFPALDLSISRSMTYYSLGSGLLALFTLAILEKSNKEAEAIFQELSDQLHRFTGIETASDVDALLLRVRFAIRQFLEAGTLPFLSARKSAGIYALFNIFMIVSTLIVASTPNWR